MNNLQYKITGYNCQVELSFEQFERLEKYDYLDQVMPMLEKLGACNIEYNGHFGSAIFFYVDTLQEAESVTKKIEEMLS